MKVTSQDKRQIMKRAHQRVKDFKRYTDLSAALKTEWRLFKEVARSNAFKAANPDLDTKEIKVDLTNYLNESDNYKKHGAFYL